MRLPGVLIRGMQRLERGLVWVIQNCGSQDIDMGERLNELRTQLSRHEVTEESIHAFCVAVLAEYAMDPKLFFEIRPSYSKENPSPSFLSHLRPSLVGVAGEMIHYGGLSKVQAEYEFRKILNEFGRPLHFIAGQKNEQFFSEILTQAHANPPPLRAVIRMQSS